MLPISAWNSSSSFLMSAYFLDISSYLPSHWSRSDSRAWTFRSKWPALTSVCRSLLKNRCQLGAIRNGMWSGGQGMG